MAEYEYNIALGDDHLSSRNWDLQRKGPIDQARHKAKQREILKNNPGDILTNIGNIVTSDGKRIVRIPVKHLDLPTPARGKGRRRIGSGDGSEKEGDVIIPGEKGQGKGKKAGQGGGEGYEEMEMTEDEALSILFENLGLPNLEDRGKQIQDTEVVWNSRTNKGPMANLDKRKSLIEALKRHALKGLTGPVRLDPDFLKFKTWEDKIVEDKSAVLVFMRDVSGSMGEFERDVTRILAAWKSRYLRKKYPRGVHTVFIAHHWTADEVSEEAFFKYGESGGTLMSSAYEKAVEVIESRFPWQNFNIYPFHYTDGYSYDEGDDANCVRLVKRMFEEHHANLFGYAEISNPEMIAHYKAANINFQEGRLSEALRAISDPRMVMGKVASFLDVKPLIEQFLSLESKKAAAA